MGEGIFLRVQARDFLAMAPCANGGSDAHNSTRKPGRDAGTSALHECNNLPKFRIVSREEEILRCFFDPCKACPGQVAPVFCNKMFADAP